MTDFSENAQYPLFRAPYSWRAKIGVIHPGGGENHIMDFFKVAPPGVAISSAGVPFHKDESVESMLHLDEHVVEMASKVLARSNAVPPDVIAWICTAGSFLRGKGHDENLIKQMQDATHIPCTTTSTAILAALKELKAKNVILLTPYPRAANEIEKKFIEDNGYKVIKADGLDLVEINVLANIHHGVWYQMAKKADMPEADCVFISCTGVNCMDVIEPLEHDLRKPVITSNQVSYWHAFKLAGIREPIQGYGTLFNRPR
jgi:maleate isomerase